MLKYIDKKMREFVVEYPNDVPDGPDGPLRADFHIHPLSHKYYRTRESLSDIALDEGDKRRIRRVIDWCVKARGLDAVALTDHDMLQASLYAREYAVSRALPVTVITGAECEVADPEAGAAPAPVHLLCLGLKALPAYTRRTPVDAMARMVRELGGRVIMAHPVYYPESFCRYAHLMDGYEYENGASGMEFKLGRDFVRNRVFDREIRAYRNSDFHYEMFLPKSRADLICNLDWEGF